MEMGQLALCKKQRNSKPGGRRIDSWSRPLEFYKHMVVCTPCPHTEMHAHIIQTKSTQKQESSSQTHSVNKLPRHKNNYKIAMRLQTFLFYKKVTIVELF